MMYSPKFTWMSDGLTEKDKEKIIRFSDSFLKKAMSIAGFISVMLLSFYLYGKLGIEKLLIFLLVLIFLQLLYLNQKVADLKNT